MSGLYPTIKFKFVPPRPIDGKPAPSDHEGHERRTAPVAQTASTSTGPGCASAAPVKRVKHPTTRQTTLSWHKPRKLQMLRVAEAAHKTRFHGDRSSPPPAAATVAAPPAPAPAAPARLPAAAAAAAAATTATTTAPSLPSPSPSPPTLCGNEQHILKLETPCCSLLSRPPDCRPITEAGTGEEASTFTPDTPTPGGGGGGGGGDCRAFIMAAETPAQDRASLDHRLLSRVEKTGSLRIPDTQEGAVQETNPQPKADQGRARVPNRPKVGGDVNAQHRRVSNRPKGCCGDVGAGQGGSGPSGFKAPPPPPPPLEVDGGSGESRGGNVSVDVTLPGCIEAPSGSDGGSSSGSVSPDLLRRFPPGVTAVSENLARSGVAGSFAAGEGGAGSSDGSDTWPESPDLLGGYACEEGSSEVSMRKVGAEEATGNQETEGRGGGKLHKKLSRARSGEASKGQQQQWHATATATATARTTTAMAHQGRPGDVPRREDLSRSATTVIAKGAKPLAKNNIQGAGSVTLEPSKKRPRQENSRPVPRNPYLNANLSSSSRARGSSLAGTQRCFPAPTVMLRDGRTIKTIRTSGMGERKYPPAEKERNLSLRPDGGKHGTAAVAGALVQGDSTPGARIFRGDAGRGGCTGSEPARGFSAEPLLPVLPPAAGQRKGVAAGGQEKEGCGSAARGLSGWARTAAVGNVSASVSRKSADRDGVCPQTGGTRPRVDTLAPKSGGGRPVQESKCVPAVNSHHLQGKGDGCRRIAAAGVADDRGLMDERKRCSYASGLETPSLVPVGASATKGESMTLLGASDAGGKVVSGRSRACPPGAVGAKARSSALRRPAATTPSAAVKPPAAVQKPPAAVQKKSPANPEQSLPQGRDGCVDGGDVLTDASGTPPEERFEIGHRHLYKHAGAGRGWRGRGRGRGGGRGDRRGSVAPVPAQGALLGGWRTERGKKGERSKRFYVTRAGQKLTGREAHRAEQEDKQAAKKGPVVMSRSTIMRMGRSASVESGKGDRGGKECLDEGALMLETYGIPAQLVDSYRKRGVRKLFDWQARCLRVDDGKPLAGGNLVYSAPTSGGKTLVAELLLLRALLQHNGTMVLLVVPFIALATEKRDYLRDVWAPLQLNVQAFHGSEGGDARAEEGVNVAVCTMEKANSIVNRLAEEGRLEALSAVVVDEMHLIGDGQRGFLLELMLTKLRMMCPVKVQLVCLSATLPNIEVMAKWLEASLYKTEFRPVELRHRVCKGRVVYKPSGVGRGGGPGQDRSENRSENRFEGKLVKVAGGGIQRVGKTTPGTDPDGVVDLVKDALARDMSVLVFCATKKWCRTTATLLANEILSDRARAKAAAAASASASASSAAASSATAAPTPSSKSAAAAVAAAARAKKRGPPPISTPENGSRKRPAMATPTGKPYGKASGVWDKCIADKPPPSVPSGRPSLNDRRDERTKGATGDVFVKGATVAATTEAHGAIAADVDGLQQQQQSTAAQQQSTAAQHQPTDVQQQSAAVQQQPTLVDALRCAGMVRSGVKPTRAGVAAAASAVGVVEGCVTGRAGATVVGVTAASAVRARLRETPVGLDVDLAHLVEAGVAFHHSGLVLEERAILEDAFRQGSIRVIVATSTLAAGVNLPAHRVIIRSPQIGIGVLDSTRYHQMAGRSGRAGVSRGQEGGKTAEGVDTACGESFLIIPKNEKKFTIPDASKLISAPLPELKSALRGAKGGGLERALLEVVVSKTVKSRADAAEFASKTLLAEQIEGQDVAQACDKAMEFLLEHNFIVATAYSNKGHGGNKGQGGNKGDDGNKRQGEGGSKGQDGNKGEGGNKGQGGNKGEGEIEDYGVAPTQLGQATFFSGLSPVAAVDVHRSLDRACQNLVVATELHALYLLTPLDGLEPDWGRFREEYTAWREEDPARIVGKAVGIEEGVLVNAAGHTSPKYGNRYYEFPRGSTRRVDLQPYRRFFGALLLQQAVEEVPIRNMVARLGIERGTLQALQKEASVFCGMVVCFCRHLQWHELANVLYSFQDRLGYSAKPELLPLVRLSRDLPPFRARALLEAGYPSPLQLAAANAAHVAEVLLRCVPFRSAGWEESAGRYRSTQARRLAENVIRLANAEILRQLRSQLRASAVAGGTSPVAARGSSLAAATDRMNSDTYVYGTKI